MPDMTLKEKAYQHLKKAIVDGGLKPGDFVTERTLAEKLQMSRTPIRSAVERLEVDGLVSYSPNKGIFITELSIERVVDFFDFRLAIESYVVRKLAERSLSEEDKMRLAENLKRQKKCVEQNNYDTFTLLDSEFHRKLVQIHGNTEMIIAMERLQDKLFQIALRVLRKDNSRIHASHNDHVHIFNAIAKGDPEESVREMVQHLEYGKRILVF